MSDEQIGQLYELMHATKDIWKTSSTLEAEAGTSDEQIQPSEDASKGDVDGNHSKS